LNQEERLFDIQDKIKSATLASGRKERDVELVSVSKTFPLKDILSFAHLGQVDFGENKVQEFVHKANEHHKMEGTPPIRWHLIGHLQRNKAKELVGRVHLFHALDSLRLATALNHHLEDASQTLSCLIQVNVSGEESKFGMEPAELDQFMDSVLALPHIRVEGLMTLASPAENPEEVRPQFALLRTLSESVRDRLTFVSTPTLSMGMSSDFEVAIEEGATLVRVGSSLFGGRSYVSA